MKGYLSFEGSWWQGKGGGVHVFLRGSYTCLYYEHWGRSQISILTWNKSEQINQLLFSRYHRKNRFSDDFRRNRTQLTLSNSLNIKSKMQCRSIGTNVFEPIFLFSFKQNTSFSSSPCILLYLLYTSSILLCCVFCFTVIVYTYTH